MLLLRHGRIEEPHGFRPDFVEEDAPHRRGDDRLVLHPVLGLDLVVGILEADAVVHLERPEMNLKGISLPQAFLHGTRYLKVIISRRPISAV